MLKSMLVRAFEIQDDVKKSERFKEMTGTLMLDVLRGDHMGKMSNDVNLPPLEVEHNINLMLYTLKRYVGWKRYLKILFMK